MEALWRKSQGMSHNEIRQLKGIFVNTLRTYLRKYQQGGIEALKQIKRNENMVQVFSKSIGMALRTVSTIPAKADPEERE